MMAHIFATLSCLATASAGSDCGSKHEASGTPCSISKQIGATLLQKRSEDWRAAQPDSVAESVPYSVAESVPTSVAGKVNSLGSVDLTEYEYYVDNDVTCQSLRQSLPQYAANAVERSLVDIQTHAAEIDTLDVLWPGGDGGGDYSNVANGGAFEVLAILEKKNVLKIGNIMGAGRGATSAILSVVGRSLGSDTLLKYYMAFEKYVVNTGDSGFTGQPPIWKEIYKRVVQDSDAFNRVKAMAWAVSKCGAEDFVFHNYKTREQVAQAFYASCDGSLLSFFGGGTDIDGISGRVDASCKAGGGVDYFPGRRNVSLMVYRTDHLGPVTKLDLSKIEELFKRGVDETVLFFKNALSTVDNPKAVVPSGGAEWTWEKYDELELSGCSAYFDLERGTEFNTCTDRPTEPGEPCTTDAAYCNMMVDCDVQSQFDDCKCWCSTRP